MNCTVVNTKEYKRPLVLETLITADLVLFSMNDRFDRVNRSFINNVGTRGEERGLTFDRTADLETDL